MEHEIKFKPVTHYYLTQEELRKTYISLALLMYNHLRYPDYDEKKALKLIEVDFKKFAAEAQSLLEQMPNNHSMHKILVFFNHHVDNISRIDEKSDQ